MKTYCKMQREKLYPLHTITYFVVLLLVSDANKVLRGQILNIAKTHRKEFGFFWERENLV